MDEERDRGLEDSLGQFLHSFFLLATSNECYTLCKECLWTFVSFGININNILPRTQSFCGLNWRCISQIVVTASSRVIFSFSLLFGPDLSKHL